MQKPRILLSLTTTTRSNWREKIKEISKLGIKELAAFPTFLGKKERQELYTLLEKTSLKKIPHVHLRDDMEKQELEYFLLRWQAQVFNIHPYPNFQKFLDEEKFRKIIFVENHNCLDKNFYRILAQSKGVCLDFSHWKVRYNNRRKGYFNFEKLLQEKEIGCCHISAVRKKWRFFWIDDHFFESLEDFNYLFGWQKFLPQQWISLELENSFQQQLTVKKYLEEKLLTNGETNLISS